MPDIQENWYPGPNYIESSQILAYCRFVGIDLSEFDSWVAAGVDRHWQKITEFLGFEWLKPFTAVVDQTVDPSSTRWFVGGKFNISDNCVNRWVRLGRGDEVAIVWEEENKVSGQLTFCQLEKEIDRLCHGLWDIGCRPGDRVGVQMPMNVESVIAALACAKLGAIAVPLFSGFASDAVIERLIFTEAKFLFIADRFSRRGKIIELDQVRKLAGQLPDILKIIVLGDSVLGENEVRWSELGNTHNLPFDPIPLEAEHPLLIAYTSGTTGKPKGLVLSQIGFAIKAGSDSAFFLDISNRDIACWLTDPGWIMSPIIIFGTLLNGGTLALYSGAYDYPDSSRMNQVIENLGVTFLGISPTLVRSLIAEKAPSRKTAGSLRVMGISGEPMTPDAYKWLFEEFGAGVLPIINYSGGTEVSGGILSNRVTEIIIPCGFFGPIPGMGAQVLDDSGVQIISGIGELALTLPSPGMPVTFWNEPERYFETYWSRWNGIWCHGDFAEINQDGTWFIRGRSDDTLKIAGKRIGPAEVESIVNSHSMVMESAAIGVPDEIKGEALVIIVSCPGVILESAKSSISQELTDLIVEKLGKPFKPKDVRVIEVLPKNRSGKILRRVIRATYLGLDPGDLSSLDNVGVLDSLRELL